MRAPNTTRRRAFRAIAAAGLATSLTAGVGGSAGAVGTTDAADAAEQQGGAAPTWTYSPDEPIADGDIAARAIGESISRDEAQRRLRADRAASPLREAAQTRWPDTFAGLWIDHDPYTINVAFTADAAGKVDELRDSFPFPHDLRAVTAVHSLDALRNLKESLVQERNSLQQHRPPADLPAAIRATGGDYDLDIDVPRGHVVVRVARPTPDLRSAFSTRHAGPVVVTGGKSAPRTCQVDDCRYAMMGGLRLDLAASGDSCSSAFTAYLTSNSSYRYVLSAGHCYRDTGIADRDHAGSYYGLVTAHRVAYDVDAERIRRDNSLWRESSKFFVQGEYPRMVSSVITFANMEKGAYVGKTGAKTGTTRGYITSKEVAPSYVPNARNFVEADLCSDRGDSGAAIWSSYTAYGILSGGPPGQCRDINGRLIAPRTPYEGTTVFGALSFATSALGVTILTGVNLRPTADFTYSCFLLDCTFDGSASADEDGGVTSWTWDFGDGSTGTGRTAQHSYLLPGLYSAKLTVKDNNGATSSKTIGITVTSS